MLGSVGNLNFKNDEDICVLLPNYPFKSLRTLKIIHNIFKSTNSDMIASAKKEFFFINDRAIKYEPQEV